MHYNGEISSAVPIIQYSPAGKIVFWVAKSFCSVDICGQYVKNKTKYIRNTVLFFIIFLGQDSCFFSGYLAKILYFHGIIAVILLGKVIKTHFFITKCKIIFITNSLNLKLHLFSLFLKILSSCTRFSPTFFQNSSAGVNCDLICSKFLFLPLLCLLTTVRTVGTIQR